MIVAAPSGHPLDKCVAVVVADVAHERHHGPDQKNSDHVPRHHPPVVTAAVGCSAPDDERGTSTDGDHDDRETPAAPRPAHREHAQHGDREFEDASKGPRAGLRARLAADGARACWRKLVVNENRQVLHRLWLSAIRSRYDDHVSEGRRLGKQTVKLNFQLAKPDPGDDDDVALWRRFQDLGAKHFPDQRGMHRVGAQISSIVMRSPIELCTSGFREALQECVDHGCCELVVEFPAEHETEVHRSDE